MKMQSPKSLSPLRNLARRLLIIGERFGSGTFINHHNDDLRTRPSPRYDGKGGGEGEGWVGGPGTLSGWGGGSPTPLIVFFCLSIEPRTSPCKRIKAGLASCWRQVESQCCASFFSTCLSRSFE